jgi:sigma-B regulation protein RsbU (phosphoserine phosphatase)
MKILIAEDDAVSNLILRTVLTQFGHEVISVVDGNAAWEKLQEDEAPSLAILDWMMPGMDGAEICSRIRKRSTQHPTYVILLTAKAGKESIVEGLAAGADDYLTKPFDREELRVRIQVGERIIKLQHSLTARIQELEDALTQIKQLQGILPICSYCNRIRDDKDYWQQVDRYFSEHSEISFSHSICPTCFETKVEPQLKELALARASQLPPPEKA